MKTEKGQTLADLLFGENSIVPPVEIRNSQEKLINALLNDATNLGSEEFEEGLNVKIDDSETRRLISAGMGAWNLASIVGRADMYPEKKMNFGNLVRALFPDPEKLLELLFAEESPLNHISKEVRSLCWLLTKQIFEKNYSNMAAGKRSHFIESIIDLFFKTIQLSWKDDTGRCVELLLNWCSRNEFEKFQEKLGKMVFEIAENISQGIIDSQTENKIKNIKFAIKHIYSKNKSPSEEMIRLALSIFELDFPGEPKQQRDLRDDMRNIAAQILSRFNPKKLETFLKEWVSGVEMSKSITMYGSILYAGDASQSFKRWCAEKFTKLGKEIEHESDAKYWAIKARGTSASKLLSQIGVTKKNLGKVFQDQYLAQAALEAWERPINRRNREKNRKTGPAPIPVKDDSILK